MRQSLPLGERRFDIVFVVFFLFNLVFISYFVDLEQVVIPDTSNFEYPPWPPRFLVDAAHWFGRNFDPLLYLRPVWRRATIWIDVLLFGPFYAAAVFAYWKGRDWIRIPSIVYASVMLTNVTIILSEEIWGPHASDNVWIVIGANAAWIIVPILMLIRMWNREHPFTWDPADDA